jgi:hypothetical protein
MSTPALHGIANDSSEKNIAKECVPPADQQVSDGCAGGMRLVMPLLAALKMIKLRAQKHHLAILRSYEDCFSAAACWSQTP